MYSTCRDKPQDDFDVQVTKGELAVVTMSRTTGYPIVLLAGLLLIAIQMLQEVSHVLYHRFGSDTHHRLYLASLCPRNNGHMSHYYWCFEGQGSVHALPSSGPMVTANQAKNGDDRKGHSLSWDPLKQEPNGSFRTHLA